LLIYLHGLNSSSRSYKAGLLQEVLAPTRVLAPSYPAHRPDAAVATLRQFFSTIDARSPPVVVGSSMGGFYGQYLARCVAFEHLFLINPALAPWSLLEEYEGQTQTTARGEDYLIDRSLIESTRKYGIDAPCDGVPTTLFLEKGDEVIDYRIAEAMYARCGRLMVFDGGDHGFRHLEEAVAVIREILGS
jgi:predicted esterase YcpF (UPF0227 family)